MCERARAARFKVADEHLRDAAYRGVRAAGVLDGGGVDGYIDAIHAEDLSLALACQAGESAPWEHFITSFRPALYAAARAIAGDEMRGRELADSLWAEMYGLEVRDGRRRSILSYFHGRRSMNARNRRRTSATITVTRPTPIAPATWRCSGRRSTLPSSRSRRGTGCG